MLNSLSEDIEVIKAGLTNLSTAWDGKEAILELKEADYNWRQTEWFGFYFELQCRRCLQSRLRIPGDKLGYTLFDAKGQVNWDFKANAINAKKQGVILNDIAAMNASIAQDGVHGVVLGRFLVEYNDFDGTFKQWHDDLKGEKSSYVKKREEENATLLTPRPKRIRKTTAELKEFLFIQINAANLGSLGINKQGRNSNDRSRPPKYALTKKNIDSLCVDRFVFSEY